MKCAWECWALGLYVQLQSVSAAPRQQGKLRGDICSAAQNISNGFTDSTGAGAGAGAGAGGCAAAFGPGGAPPTAPHAAPLIEAKGSWAGAGADCGPPLPAAGGSGAPCGTLGGAP